MKFFSQLLLVIFCFTVSSEVMSQNSDREFYELRLYHLENQKQEKTMDEYLQKALIPALERAGVERTGVFKPIENDSAFGKAIYLLIPYKSAEEYLEISRDLHSDSDYLAAAGDFFNAAHDDPPYERAETILLNAFEGMPQHEKTSLKNATSERIYELRSYESATEDLFRNKVRMFNEGEIEIFKRLKFNPIFFGEVIAGSRMPNLMYMISHANREAMKENWENFGKDEKWKEMSGLEEYQNNVSHIDAVLLHATEYSGI